jgi:hypothetical protein
MSLSAQEQRCVTFACRYLEEHYGGSWSIQQCLDDLNLSEPTPEVIVSNGQKTAAIEVKRLTGDLTYQEYIASLLSNEKVLVPSCGGSYYLCPPVDFRLPMPANLRKLVKREIERVAPSLSPGEKGAIRIPRQGHISLISKSGPPFISCVHGSPYSEIMNRIREKVTGKFMLIDEGLEHSFVTEECKDAFVDAVVAACNRRLEGNIAPFDWNEEWELARIDDGDGDHTQGGVWIIATSGACSMQASVKECVHAVLDNAVRKFKRKRWADLHVVVLESSGLTPAGLAANSIETFESDDKGRVDHFLLVEGKSVNEASALVSSMSRSAEANEQRRHQHIIDSPISEARVQRFKEDYLKGRQDIGATEKIFRHYGAFQQQNERNNRASFGFNMLVYKGPFVDGSNWADLKGWEFAVAEERHLLKNLHDNLAESVIHTGQVLSEIVAPQPEGILNAAKRMADLLGDRAKSLIVLATHLDTETMLSLNKALTTPGWELGDELKTNWILGKHEHCPVLYLNDPDLDSLYIVDVTRFASLVQYDPLVDLRVLAIDEGSAKRMLEDNADLKLDVNALLSMVHLILYQSYEIQIHDRNAVWAAKVSPLDGIMSRSLPYILSQSPPSKTTRGA